jgi:DNA-binding PadR family transcriptional regulator
MPEDLAPFLPLSPPTLLILLSLAGHDRHGYGIMQEVSRQSEGQYKLGPGTLYDSLRKFMDQRIVEEVAAPKSLNEDPRRRYYRLTKLGRNVLRAEIVRLEGVVQQARLHLGFPTPRRTE